MMMGGGEEGNALGERMEIEPGFQLQLIPAADEMVGTSGGGEGGGGGQRGKGEKMMAWGQQETRDFIAIRADLERDFTSSRRNKTVWETAALRMREKGHRRTSEQCKCKWKNLINRYKGKETTDAESERQCPFFEELRALFTERARNMQRLLLESEPGVPQCKKKSKRLAVDKSSDDLSDDNEEGEDGCEEEKQARTKKKKVDQSSLQQETQTPAVEKSRSASSINDLLHEFLQQQQRLEVHWWEIMDRRAQERQTFDQEWRNSMEKLERERLVLDQTWRDREDQRRTREEGRAEKRDALLTTLLNKLIQDGL